MNTNTYLSTLIERQQAEGWSDREMGRQLKIGQTSWPYVKSGKRRMTLYFLRKAMERFPEYNAIALTFLFETASVGNRSVTHEGRAA